MDLFTSDAEVIGTDGVKPGQGEWYTSSESARELIEGDWDAGVIYHGDAGEIAD